MQKAKCKSSGRAAVIQISLGFKPRKEHGRIPSRPLLPFAFCLLPFALLACLLRLFPPLCSAQSPSPAPYAAIDHDAVSYNGPGRDAGHDLAGSEVRLGLLAPLAGPRQAEGEALRHAAEMAVEEENANPLPGGHRLALVTRDESGPWGQASSEIVHMVFDDQALALITSTDGGAAHLAEQVGNKIGVPILTLSSDATTTEINLPWIFRLGPGDAMQAQAFARNIYQDKQMQRVVLLIQNDHDGRVGGEEFLRAAGEMKAPAPMQVIVEPERLAEDELRKEITSAQAVVIWTDAATANLLAPIVRAALPSAPLYLCRKAAKGDWSTLSQTHCHVCGGDAGIWTAEGVNTQSSPHEAFAQHYRQRFGAEPGIAAAQAYDAVRVLAASLRQSGPNRARLRDALAGVSAFPGASGIVSFDHAGNNTSQVTLLKLR
jgi:branched-chain amino acid transport system substrate-binding protein